MNNSILESKSNNHTSTNSFEFLKKLGEGTYSSVYKAKRKIDGYIYALKKVYMKTLSTKEKQNSLNQVRILASIKNKNIIAYKEAFYQGENLYIIMEYADNGDLFADITKRRKSFSYYDEADIWGIFIQICYGLHALHKFNIIHRDLKSANVFLNKNGDVKLGDMNVSKVGKLCSTQTGTPYYASPQVWKDIPYDYKSDIWSMGCVLYQIVTLFPPFRGGDMEQLYSKISKGVYEKIPRQYSQNLDNLLSLLLQKSPITRPSCQFILKNIHKIIPQMYKSLPKICEVIDNFSNQGYDQDKKLLKTINFPQKKKIRGNNLINMSSMLPTPAYQSQVNSPLSQKQNNQNTINKNNKPTSLFIPSIRIQLKSQLPFNNIQNHIKNSQIKKVKKSNKNKKIEIKDNYYSNISINNRKRSLNDRYKLQNVENNNNQNRQKKLVLPQISRKKYHPIRQYQY